MDTFYTDHWKQIEADRLERYEAMFQFRPELEPHLEALELKSSSRVLDFGCGPGFLSMEIARRTNGGVIGADLNEEFVARATERAANESLSNLTYVHLTGDSLPLEDKSVDRVLAKNVLEYVPDLDATLNELKRVIAPGGFLQITDSDWGFVIVEPWGKDRTDKFFKAASPAFKEPQIGRKASGALARVGYTDIKVRMQAGVDLNGWGMNVLANMMSYIRQFDTLPEAEVAAMKTELEEALENGSYMFVLPQFFIRAGVS